MKSIKEQEIIESTKAHFPRGISKDIHNFVINEVLVESRYLFVTRKKDERKAFCTHCKKNKDADGLKHKEETNYVHCMSLCKVQFDTYSRKHMIDDAYFVYYEKSKLNDKAIIARGFYVEMDFSEDYKNVEPKYTIEAMYLFEMGNPVFLKRCGWKYIYYELRKSVFSLY